MDRRKFLAETIKAGGVAAYIPAFIKPANWADPLNDVPPSTNGDKIQVKNKEELIDAVKNITPGDEIIISAGTYENVHVEIDAKATEKSPIIIRAAVKHKAVFTGSTQFYVTGSYIIISGLRFSNSQKVPKYGVCNFWSADYCRITNCEFEDLEGMWGIVTLNNGASDNRIDNNHFLNFRYRAVRLGVHKEALEYGPPVRNRIDHNIIRDIPDSGGGSAEAIALGSWGYPWNKYETFTTIENNLFLRCNGENEIITVKTRSNVIRNNAFIHCITGELVLRSTDNTTVEGNRFEYCNHGIRISGYGHRVVNNVIVNPGNTGIRVTYGTEDVTHPTTYKRVHSIVVAHNTIINAGATGIRVGDFKGSSSTNERFKEPPFNHPTGAYTLDVAPYNSVFVNNIVVGREGTLFEIIDSPDNIYSNNLLFAEGDATIGDKGDFPILKQPIFQQPENGDYRLDKDSPESRIGMIYPIMPLAQMHPGNYLVGAEGALPEVGPSKELLTEVFSLPIPYLEDNLPPSSYEILLK